jgi:AraC-like DNA-binding protein
MPIPESSKAPVGAKTDMREVPPPGMNLRAKSQASLLKAIGAGQPSGRPIVHVEKQWRLPDILAKTDLPHPRIFASRWSGADLEEKSSEIAGDYHVLSVCLLPSEFSLRLGTNQFSRKKVQAGMMQLTRPALPASIVYHTPYDTLHLHVKNHLFKECFEWAHGKRPATDLGLRDPDFSRDPMIEQLGSALLAVSETDGAYGELYADSLSLAIVTRLLMLYGEVPATKSPPNVEALPKWRLRKAIDFMEAHADQRITLADLANAVGLSRMYFAAQFRKATGLRPHEFFLSRRIDKAKRLLETTDLTIAEVAFSVGFNTQNHFTNVFKRFSGMTPYRWKLVNRL